MHGGEGPPHDSDSYRGDSAPHGQEEAPPQKALNFVFTPFMKKQSTRLMKKKTHEQKSSQLLSNFSDFILLIQI